MSSTFNVIKSSQVLLARSDPHATIERHLIPTMLGPKLQFYRAPDMGTRMKARFSALVLAMVGIALFCATSTSAATTGYAYCGTYGSYVLMYKSNDQFEELGKLRCGEKVDILNRWFDYVQVRAGDGRVGWVHYAEISNAPGEAPTK